MTKHLIKNSKTQVGAKSKHVSAIFFPAVWEELNKIALMWLLGKLSTSDN